MSKIFGTDGIRCIVNQEPLTAETCLKISKAAGYLLSNKKSGRNRVIISKDTRLSGYLFEPLITSGFISMGMDVILVGPLPTPALPMLIKSLRADMGVMITASHNTYEYNGLKFFDDRGFKINKVLENKIENIVHNKKKYDKIINLGYDLGKAMRLEDAQGRYSEYLKSTLNKNIKLKKYKIVLDCANGATYHIAPNIFWELGCDVITINDRPSGKNINKDCGAINTSELSKKVIKNNADLGFAFDGDGDRVIVIDEKGIVIDGDKIIALFAKNLTQSRKLNKKTVVTTVMSNLGFEKYLNDKLGVKLIRTNVGDINVISKMKKNSYNLGGEQSGHIILGNYMYTGDSILTALKIIEIMSERKLKTSKIFSLYEEFPQIKTNLYISKKLHSTFDKKFKKISDSFKKKYPKLRFVLRKSGTEPLIRTLVEGDNNEDIKIISKSLNQQIKKILNVK